MQLSGEESTASPHWGEHLVLEMGGNQQLLGGEQSISAHANILTSTLALHTPAPLSLTFTEEKGITPQLNPNKNIY